MRLTHAITMQAENRADLEVTVVPDGALAITLEQTDLDGEHLSSSVYLSFDQYDVITELVHRVRPGGLAARSGWVLCGHPGDNQHGTSCVLKAGHGWAGGRGGNDRPIFHVDEDGRLFADQAAS